MDPPLIEHRCLEYQYTKLGRQTYFGRWTPQVIEQKCLEYQYEKTICEARVNLEVSSYLADKPSLANGPPVELRIYALNTGTPNLADKPTLADGPPG